MNGTDQTGEWKELCPQGRKKEQACVSKTHYYPRVVPNFPRITADIRKLSHELITVFSTDRQG